MRNGLKKKVERWRLLHDTWKFYELQLSMSYMTLYHNTVTPFHLLNVYSFFHLRWQSWATMTDHIAWQFPSGPLRKKFANHWFNWSPKCLPAMKYYDSVAWVLCAVKPHGNVVNFLPPQDYELQLMTYKAFVESQQKSPGKRRRMLSSSDAITQEVKGWGKDTPLSSLKERFFCRGPDSLI